MKLGIIYDVVKVSFGTDEEASPNGVANVGAQVEEEVIGVKMGSATCGKIAIAVRVVETYALAADTRHEISVDFLV